ncbi:MAG: hypothetical protein HY954_11045 [Deltaproteobacteria bacterium]|nr:hypothetical protein [Deltaproteobacteria bacterium]
MKKFVFLTVAAIFALTSFTACKKKETAAPAPGGIEQKGTMETTTPATPAPGAPQMAPGTTGGTTQGGTTGGAVK